MDEEKDILLEGEEAAVPATEPVEEPAPQPEPEKVEKVEEVAEEPKQEVKEGDKPKVYKGYYIKWLKYEAGEDHPDFNLVAEYEEIYGEI